MELEDKELLSARRVAKSVSNKWSSVTTDEVEAHLYLWLCENYRYVERYRHEGKHGQNKLRLALARAATKHAIKEQEEQTGYGITTGAVYTADQIKKALPYIWEHPDMATTVITNEEGMAYEPVQYDSAAETARAVLSDVSGAYYSLTKPDQRILAQRYLQGLTYQQIADVTGSTREAERKHVTRAIDRLLRRIGSESSSWHTEPRRRPS